MIPERCWTGVKLGQGSGQGQSAPTLMGLAQGGHVPLAVVMVPAAGIPAGLALQP